MHYQTPLIVWHGEALHSCDFQPKTNTLATTGINQDRDYLRIWRIDKRQSYYNPQQSSNQLPLQQSKQDNDDGSLLLKHFKISYQYSVRISTPYAGNMLKFSPNAKHLAFASDSQCLLVLSKRMLPLQIGSSQYIMKWGEDKSLRGHLGSVLAISWLPCSDFLVSGSIDNTIIIWNLAKNSIQQRIQGFQSYVTGIAVDPRGEFMTVQSNDQQIRVYQVGNSSRSLKFYPQEQHQRIRDFDIQNMQEREEQESDNKMKVDIQQQQQQQIKQSYRFIQNQLEFNHFYRRLDWSPDGKFYLTTSTFVRKDDNPENMQQYGSYLFVRELPEIPLLCIGNFTQSITCVKFCQEKFQYEPEYFTGRAQNDIDLRCHIKAEGIIQLDVAYVFAIASSNEVKIFSTACTTPLAALKNIHAGCIVDLSWSSDKILTIASLDGFLTICSFDEGFLGRRVVEQTVIDTENNSKVGNMVSTSKQMHEKKHLDENLSKKIMITSKTGKQINISKVQI